MSKYHARTTADIFDSNNSREALTSTQREAVKAARDLGYGDEVVTRIKAATNIIEVANIMKTARRRASKEG